MKTNGKPPREQISAYYDGELSADERREVERMLAESDEARRELDEIAQLSEMLRSLPRESAPVELKAAVMHRAERDTLLETTPAAQSTARRPTASRWFVAVGALATAAAGLLLMYVTHPSGRSTETIASHTDGTPALRSHGERDKALEEMEFVAKADDRTAALPAAGEPRVTDRVDAARVEALRAAPGTASAGGETGSAGRLAMRRARAVPASPSRSGEQPAEPSPGDGEREGRSIAGFGGAGSPLSWEGHQRLFTAQDLKRVEIGDVVPYFNYQGDAVPVIEMTVVDIRRALGVMEVLLSRNAIEPARKDKAASTQSDEVDDGLVAVYVETTDAQLTSVLNDLQTHNLIVAMKLEPPLTVAGLAEEAAAADAASKSEERLARLERMLRSNQSIRARQLALGRAGEAKARSEMRKRLPPADDSVAADAPRKGADAKPSRPESAEKTTARALAVGAKSAPAAPKPNSFSVVLQLPNLAGPEPQVRNLADHNNAVTGAVADHGPAGSNNRNREQRGGSDSQSPPAPVRVLFLLKPQSVAPAAPPDSTR